jgi:hypothetical protein
MTATITFDLSLLYFVAANSIALLAYILIIKHRARRQQDDRARLSPCIREYFREKGLYVSVNCVNVDGSEYFTAFIDSEPMRRFRFSHLIEMALRNYVDSTCKLKLDKVCWRFMISYDADDIYIPGRLAIYEAEESNLEAFDEITQHMEHEKRQEQR